MSLIQYSQEGAVAVIQLDRPPVNALSESFSEEIGAAITRANDDPSVRAVVIWGDPHFAAGADIKGFSESHAAHSAGEEVEVTPASGLVAAIRLMETAPKPYIAAIKGYALGGGLERRRYRPPPWSCTTAVEDSAPGRPGGSTHSTATVG